MLVGLELKLRLLLEPVLGPQLLLVLRLLQFVTRQLMSRLARFKHLLLELLLAIRPLPQLEPSLRRRWQGQRQPELHQQKLLTTRPEPEPMPEQQLVRAKLN